MNRTNLLTLYVIVATIFIANMVYLLGIPFARERTITVQSWQYVAEGMDARTMLNVATLTVSSNDGVYIARNGLTKFDDKASTAYAILLSNGSGEYCATILAEELHKLRAGSCSKYSKEAEYITNVVSIVIALATLWVANQFGVFAAWFEWRHKK